MSAIVQQYVYACAIGRSCDSLSFWLRDVLDINGSLLQVMVLSGIDDEREYVLTFCSDPRRNRTCSIPWPPFRPASTCAAVSFPFGAVSTASCHTSRCWGGSRPINGRACPSFVGSVGSVTFVTLARLLTERYQ